MDQPGSSGLKVSGQPRAQRKQPKENGRRRGVIEILVALAEWREFCVDRSSRVYKEASSGMAKEKPGWWLSVKSPGIVTSVAMPDL